MSNFIFKDKEKMQIEKKQRRELTEGQLRTITKLDEQFDENAYAYQEELAEMNAEERANAKAAMEEGYYKQLRQGKSDAALSDRQKNKLQSQSKDMVKDSGKKVAEFRKKVDALAKKMATSDNIDKSSVTLSGLENYVIPKDASKDTKNQIKILRKSAPKIFGRLREYENLYEKLQSDTLEEKGLVKFVASELENVRAEWRLMQKRIYESIPTEVKLFSSQDTSERYDAREALTDTYVTIDLKTFDKDHVIENDDTHEPVNEEVIESEIKKSLEKKEVNWDRDIQAEIKEAEAALEKLKKENGDAKAINDQEKLVNDLKVEEFTKDEMRKIIDNSHDPNLTMKEIERTVTNYLKEITKNCEIKFRAKPLGVKHILNSCAMSADEPVYKELLHKMYSPNANINPRGNLTFGYLGGKDVHGYIGKKVALSGTLGDYGHVALKLNKEKVKNRCGFIAGNSKQNYAKQKARSIEHPDILGTGHVLPKLYERAKAIEKGAKMMSPEQEAVSLDFYPYFECQVVGSITAADVDEIQFTMSELPRNIDELKAELLEGPKSQALWDLFKQVNTINSDPNLYNRSGMKPLKITVWGCNDVEVTFEELKMIYQSRKEG